jgi:hypothetical protein
MKKKNQFTGVDIATLWYFIMTPSQLVASFTKFQQNHLLNRIQMLCTWREYLSFYINSIGATEYYNVHLVLINYMAYTMYGPLILIKVRASPRSRGNIIHCTYVIHNRTTSTLQLRFPFPFTLYTAYLTHVFSLIAKCTRYNFMGYILLVIFLGFLHQ